MLNIMAEENKPKDYTEAEIVKAQSNLMAKSNGLKQSYPESDITQEDIKNYLSKVRKEKRQNTNDFIDGREQLSFDMFSQPEQKVEVKVEEPKVAAPVINKVDPVLDTIVFVPEEPVKEPTNGVSLADSKEFANAKETWNKITEDTAKIAKEMENEKKSEHFVPEKKFSINSELSGLISKNFDNKFESGMIVRDEFIVYETSSDFIASTPSETRHIFAKHDDKGVTKFIEINGEDKNKIREAYPELEGWVVVKQNVREADYDKDFTESNSKLADRIETMIHAKMLDKNEVNQRVKDIEAEFNEAKNIEKSGIVVDVDDDETPSKKSIKKPKI